MQIAEASTSPKVHPRRPCPQRGMPAPRRRPLPLPLLLLQLTCCVSFARANTRHRSAGDKVYVQLFVWQGCRDTTVYGQHLIAEGLDQGLGVVASFEVIYCSGALNESSAHDPQLHKWVACANYVVGAKDHEYWWYRVAVCANPGRTVAGCIGRLKMPARERRPIQECMDGPLADRLVADMHVRADKYSNYPTVLVEGKQLPRPDKTGNSVKPLLEAVCEHHAHEGDEEHTICGPANFEEALLFDLHLLGVRVVVALACGVVLGGALIVFFCKMGQTRAAEVRDRAAELQLMRLRGPGPAAPTATYQEMS